MPFYVKNNDEWVLFDGEIDGRRPYVKAGGSWQPVKEAYVKDSGTWKSVFYWDPQPPEPPMLALEIVDGRFIRVKVRSPKSVHDVSLTRIRVLYSGDKGYTNGPTGKTYISTSADNWPHEQWSDWLYNQGGDRDHPDSTNWDQKDFAGANSPNPTDKTNLSAGDYLFTAFAQDINGAWSTATTAMVTMPKKGDPDAIPVSAKFRPHTGGTWSGNNMSTWTANSLEQDGSPLKRGIMYYGNQLASQIGTLRPSGTVSIKSAQIWVVRSEDDKIGEEKANIYLYWHKQTDKSGNEPSRFDLADIGQLEMGEGKWLNLPAAHIKELEKKDFSLRGFGFGQKDPDKASANPDDRTRLVPLDNAPRQGELSIQWVETPPKK
jgi:hypothetical protein